MEWIPLFAEQHPLLVYLVAFLGVLLEGDISLLIFGALSKEGLMDFPLLVLVSFTAAFIHDLIFWRFGWKIASLEKKKYLFFNLEKPVEFLRNMRLSIGVYIFVSKFAWNFNRVVLISTGCLKFPLKKLMKYTLPADLLWAIFVSSLGYIFADKTQIFRQTLGTAAILSLALVVAFALFEIYLKKIFQKMMHGQTNNLSRLINGNRRNGDEKSEKKGLEK